MTLLWWHWLALGMVLIGLELVVPSFTIIWFGFGALLVSGLLALIPHYPLPAQILTWAILSGVCTLAWFRFFNPRTSRSLAGSSKDAVVGVTGLVVRAPEPHGKGMVRFHLPLLGADEWQCRCDEPLEVGDRVKVLDVEGHVMKVEKLGKREH